MMDHPEYTAKEIVTATFTNACAPDLIASITSARFEKSKREIVAQVVLFDGISAIARLRRWAFGWSIGWDRMDGGDCTHENGFWRRVERGGSVMADHKRPPVGHPSGYAEDRPSGYADRKPSGYAANLPARKTVAVPYPTSNSGVRGMADVTIAAAPCEKDK